ncbi:hypothetical protein Q9L58_010203 [Maublancomyces gigas]|uniref:Uncharacterized protein n=1 Tax=Discina gigas TaxID=1032678 RepID=A0ABR3G504_9PEZI
MTIDPHLGHPHRRALNQAWLAPSREVRPHVLNTDGSTKRFRDRTPNRTQRAHEAYLAGLSPDQYLDTFRGLAENLASPDTPTRKRSNLVSSTWSSTFSQTEPDLDAYVARIRSKLPPAPSVSGHFPRHPETLTTPSNPPSESDYKEIPRPILRAPEVLDDSEKSEGWEVDGSGENAVLLIDSILKRNMTSENGPKQLPPPPNTTMTQHLRRKWQP